MATLTFETLRFSKREKVLRVVFLKNFVFTIPLADVLKIGNFAVDKGDIIFDNVSEKRARNKFMMLIERGFGHLEGILTRKPTTYIHQNSGIPLIGSRYVGIMDRGTNFIEIKPITGCTMGCTFCSVDEGIGSKKAHDFVVERDYLVSETAKLLAFKDCDNIHVYINVHGEPLLYADIVGLVEDLAALEWVNDITIITTTVLLTERLVDDLALAGLTEFNVSISAMDVEQGKILMGTKAYNIEHVKKIVRYAAGKVKTSIAPVWMDGINDDEMEKIIAFAQEIDVPVRIQKFCHNKFGRNPIEEISWEDFYEKIAALEKKTGATLKEDESSYKLTETKELERPFKKGQTIEAQIVSVGRYTHERLCVAGDRLITVPKCRKDKGKMKVKILRTTHNVFVGESV
jgi:uncharacterized protein